jgi:hypothetical protein
MARIRCGGRKDAAVIRLVSVWTCLAAEGFTWVSLQKENQAHGAQRQHLLTR